MGSGKIKPKKNPTAGGPTHGSSGRRPRPQTAQIFFKHESRSKAPEPKCYGNTVGYTYPGTSDPIETNTDVEVPTYSYHPGVAGDLELGLGFQREDGEELGSGEASHLGLGFVEKEEEEEVAEMEATGEDQVGEKEEMIQNELHQFLTPEVKKKGGKSEGFLSIGGYRVYTEDTSSPEEDMDDDDGVSSDDEDDDVDELKPSDDDEELSRSGEEEEDDDDDVEEEEDEESDIDDEIVQDYMEGIGGADEFLSGLSKKKLKELESESESGKSESESESESDEDGFLKTGKLGGVKLMKASEVYGMEGQKWKGKGKSKVDSTSSRIELLTLDHVAGLKDCRFVSKTRKSASSQLSRSWPGPGDGRRSKKTYDISSKKKKYGSAAGERKKHRKELIAEKRRHRMLNRGVDLEQINAQLRQIVVDEVDMHAFQPMHSRDCSQVQHLASIYGLKSGFEGSGKKRFVMVTRTVRTGLPSSVDQVRLDKLLGVNLDDGDFPVVDVNSKNKARGATKRSSSERPKRNKLSGRKNASGKQETAKASFAKRPVSFVSSGTMLGDSVTKKVLMETIVDSKETTIVVEKVGAFEMHTTGFGSKMMAKMGFIEGRGLGKDGQGMVQPIEPVQRPKSLGLGVEFESGEASGTKVVQSTPKVVRSNTKTYYSTKRIGGFEKHTKGFGSKMMEKMGFVPGSGLGKDGQGIIDPLMGVRRPRSLGLGAD